MQAGSLLIQSGWEFSDEQPVEGLGHASLLVNPASSIVDEILRELDFLVAALMACSAQHRLL